MYQILVSILIWLKYITYIVLSITNLILKIDVCKSSPFISFLLVLHNLEGNNGILLPKLFWPTVRKICSYDPQKLLKFKAEGREFAKISRSLEQFV